MKPHPFESRSTYALVEDATGLILKKASKKVLTSARKKTPGTTIWVTSKTVGAVIPEAKGIHERKKREAA